MEDSSGLLEDQGLSTGGRQILQGRTKSVKRALTGEQYSPAGAGYGQVPDGQSWTVGRVA